MYKHCNRFDNPIDYNKYKKMKSKFNFTMSGFLIALLLVAMYFGLFGNFMVQIANEQSISNYENSLFKYNATSELLINSEEIVLAADIQQQSGVLDVIGGYFSSGYAALKTSVSSFALFEDMMNEFNRDVPQFGYFKVYIISIILLALFIGVIITVLVKMRI